MGEIAAIATSICWTFSAVIFTFAGRRVGAVVLNRIRLVFALLFLIVAHLLLLGTPFPRDAGWERWFWLGLSGLAGLTLGDLALFQSYLLVGPAVGTLIMATVPVLSVVLAWIFLGETLSLGVNIGILVAMSGIALVVIERLRSSNVQAGVRRNLWRGLFFGFLAALGQTVGLILTKRGLSGGYSSLSGVFIRMTVGAVLMWIPAVASRQTRLTFSALRDPKTAALIVGGSLVGPFAGIWLSTVAVQHTAVGVASTLMSLNPIFLLPISSAIFKEKITLRAALGTFITIAGVSLIFLL